MEITYLGHSSFKLKGKGATVVTDPYEKSIGLNLPTVSADIVTVSHQHDDHNATAKVGGTARRKEPYVISAPGEYEILGVGVFGWGSYHDQKNGEERGKNTIYTIHMDGVIVAHLGDLGHLLSDSLVDDIGDVDVLLVPVGGFYTINAEEAAKVVAQLQPSYVVPMHYKTEKHNKEVFAQVTPLDDFLKVMEAEAKEPQASLKVNEPMPDETEVVILESIAG